MLVKKLTGSGAFLGMQVTKLVATLRRLDAQDATRIDLTEQLLNK